MSDNNSKFTHNLDYGFFLGGESKRQISQLKEFIDSKKQAPEPVCISLPSSRQSVQKFCELTTDDILRKLFTGHDFREEIRKLVGIAQAIKESSCPIYIAPSLSCLDEYCFLALCSDSILTNKPLEHFGFTCRLFMEIYVGALTQLGVTIPKDRLKYERGLWNLDTQNLTVYVPSRRKDLVIDSVDDYAIDHLKKKKSPGKKLRAIESWINSQSLFDQINPRFYSRLARKLALSSPLYNLTPFEKSGPSSPLSQDTKLSPEDAKLPFLQRESDSPRVVSHHGAAIDVTVYVPPKNMIYKLLKNNSKLFLFASGPLSLHEALELFYSRMISVFSSEQSAGFRDRNVFWFVSEGEDDENRSEFWIEWKFFSKDRLKLRLKNNVYFFQKLSENRSDHGYGWLELPNSINDHSFDADSDNSLAILRGFTSQLGLGVIKTSLPKGMQWTLGEWVSGVFLEHMIHLCAEFKIDLNQMFVVLAERGHGRIADDIYWDHFLRGRNDPYDLTLASHTEQYVESIFKSHGALYISPDARAYGHLKSLKIESKLKKARLLANRLSVVEKLRIDLYLWHLAEKTAHECFLKGYVKSFDDAEILIGEVLGFSRKLCRLSHMDLFYSQERLNSMDIKNHE